MSVGDGTAGVCVCEWTIAPEHLVRVVGRDRQAQQVVADRSRSGSGDAALFRVGSNRRARPPSAAGRSPMIRPHISFGYSRSGVRDDRIADLGGEDAGWRPGNATAASVTTS